MNDTSPVISRHTTVFNAHPVEVIADTRNNAKNNMDDCSAVMCQT